MKPITDKILCFQFKPFQRFNFEWFQVAFKTEKLKKKSFPMEDNPSVKLQNVFFLFGRMNQLAKNYSSYETFQII